MTLRETLAGQPVRPPSAVAIGTFDGVHLGHRLLISQLAERASRIGGSAVVLTFHPRPVEVLRPGALSRYLCSLDRRIQLLAAAGADVVIPVEFTDELSQTRAEDFVRVLVDQLGMGELVGGPDLAFGRGREGTPELLRQIGSRLGFDVFIVPTTQVGEDVVRTSTIQRLLDEGNVAKAADLLGRTYSVEGTVVHGAGRGKQLGIPTANVAVAENIVLPLNGIYATRFQVDGQEFIGAASLGTNPTFGDGHRSLEVHVLDFSGDIYDRSVEVEFVAYLRPEARFDSVADLLRQIDEDIRQTRDIFLGQPRRST